MSGTETYITLFLSDLIFYDLAKSWMVCRPQLQEWQIIETNLIGAVRYRAAAQGYKPDDNKSCFFSQYFFGTELMVCTASGEFGNKDPLLEA